MPDWVILGILVIVAMVLLALMIYWRVAALSLRDRYKLMKDHLEQCKLECRDQVCAKLKAEGSLSGARREIVRLNALADALATTVLPEVPEL